MYRSAAITKTTTTADIATVRTSFVRALALMPRRFMPVNSRANSVTHTGYGSSGTTFIAALLHQIVQMIGLST